LSWLDKNRFSVSFDIFTIPRTVKEQEKNSRRALLVGGKYLPWLTIDTVCQFIDRGKSNDDEMNTVNCLHTKPNSKFAKNGSKACTHPPKEDILKNSSNFTKTSQNPSSNVLQDEMLRICFNHTGVHYDCYEKNGTRGTVCVMCV
jgi:hypothetical protein